MSLLPGDGRVPRTAPETVRGGGLGEGPDHGEGEARPREIPQSLDCETGRVSRNQPPKYQEGVINDCVLLSPDFVPRLNLRRTL